MPCFAAVALSKLKAQGASQGKSKLSNQQEETSIDSMKRVRDSLSLLVLFLQLSCCQIQQEPVTHTGCQAPSRALSTSCLGSSACVSRWKEEEGQDKKGTV
jgi:hypothetical protein